MSVVIICDTIIKKLLRTIQPIVPYPTTVLVINDKWGLAMMDIKDDSCKEYLI